MSTATSGVVPVATVEVVGTDDPVLISAIRRAAELAVRAHGLTGEIALALVSDEEMARLNLRHRGIEGPTDVLTFPSTHGGDIAIAAGYLARQAARRGVSPAHEAAILAIHGTLHLAGYDDLEDADRAAMQGETKRLADALGVPCESDWTSLPEHP